MGHIDQHQALRRSIYCRKDECICKEVFPGCKIERDSSNHPETECPSSTHQGASKGQGAQASASHP